MTDEDLQAIRAWLTNETHRWEEPGELMPSYPWVTYFKRLLAEIERLRAENAELERTRQAADECISAMRDEANEGGKLIAQFRKQNAAMREIVQAVATEDTCAYEGDAGDDVHCVFCQSEDDWRAARARDELHHIVHTPDCPVTKARAILVAAE